MANGGLPIVLNSALPKSADVLIVEMESHKKQLEVDIGKILTKELSFSDDNS